MMTLTAPSPTVIWLRPRKESFLVYDKEEQACGAGQAQ